MMICTDPDHNIKKLPCLNHLLVWFICRCFQGPLMFKREWHSFRLRTGCLTVWCDRYGHTCLMISFSFPFFDLHLKAFGFVRFNGFDATVSSRTQWVFFKHKFWLLKSVNNDLCVESLKCEMNKLKKRFSLNFVLSLNRGPGAGDSVFHFKH